MIHNCHSCGHLRKIFDEAMCLCRTCATITGFKPAPENKMAYEPVPKRYVSMHTIQSSRANRDEIENFCAYWHKQGYLFFQQIPVDKHMIDYAKDKQCLIDWFLEKKLIKQVFAPFDLTIRITSQLDYWILWHRMNAGTDHFESYKKSRLHSKEVHRLHSQEMLPEALGNKGESLNKRIRMFEEIGKQGRDHGAY